jgi:hypothetical protein
MTLRDWRGRIRHGHRRLRIILTPGILASVAATVLSPPPPTIAAVLAPSALLLFGRLYKASVRTSECGPLLEL